MKFAMLIFAADAKPAPTAVRNNALNLALMQKVSLFPEFMKTNVLIVVYAGKSVQC